MEGEKKLVIFDFDWSLINENSDTWVIYQLTPQLIDEMKDFRKSMDWTSLMTHMLGRMMRDENITRDDLSQCLRRIPYFPEAFQALKLAKENGAEIIILSDANEFYIHEILSEHNLNESVDIIITNFANFDENGVLSVVGYHHSNPHSCPLCPANLCKGKVLESLLEKRGGRDSFQAIAYIGDGGGDFCPCVSLSSMDSILCRNSWALHKKIVEKSPPVAAQILPWEDGVDILKYFQNFFSIA